ncbi:MAG: type II toxin-antitoxin system VapC family toxin [Syntrophomonadaceae bacterium]|nr:type II toxin-antitoxin system VapC family toxin [Syntrophomonadaceae bacterium]
MAQYKSRQLELFMEQITQYQTLLLDTNALIYFLDDVSGYADLLEPIFNLAEQGQIRINLSAISEAELLVKPYREGNLETVKVIKFWIEEFPNLKVIPVSREIAHKAAELRGVLGLRLPDALVLATAINTDSELIVGNDFQMLRKAAAYLPGLTLEHYLS